MNMLRKELRDLVRVNEEIQSVLAHGNGMTDDEKLIIQFCANELLASASGRNGVEPHQATGPYNRTSERS